MSRHVDNSIKLRILKRDGFSCCYCGITGAEAELEIDHIIPFSKGGSNKISNLQTTCRKCNVEKSDKLNFKPRLKIAKEHNGVDSKVGLSQSEFGRKSLIGMFVHIRAGDPKPYLTGKPAIQYQGQIVGTHDDKILVQLFSWLDGRPTNVTVFDKSEIFDSKLASLYLNGEEWLRTAELESKFWGESLK